MGKMLIDFSGVENQWCPGTELNRRHHDFQFPSGTFHGCTLTNIHRKKYRYFR